MTKYLSLLLLLVVSCHADHKSKPTPEPTPPLPFVPIPDLPSKAGQPYQVEIDAKGFKIDGQYRLLRGGSVQWFRLPESTWNDRLRKYKDMGFNVLDIYIAWNQVEPIEGQFNFDKPNLRRFLELAHSYGLYVAVRPGPYITNEMDGGGLPAWLTRKATKKSYDADGKPNLRTADPDFIEPVKRYLSALNAVLKPYMADQGGPVVLYVLENEYTWFERSFSLDHLFTYDGGLERPIDQPLRTGEYFTSLRDIVRENGVTVPLVTCPGDGKISAMGDVPGVLPFPNIYEWANPGQPEEIVYDLLREMRDPEKHNGIYQNASSGSMELNRNTQETRRLLMGGLDAVFTFNVAGMIQQGYMNSLTLGARAGDVAPHWGDDSESANDWVGTIFDFSDPARFADGFLAPIAGYFGNVIDYDGAISPSGVQRDLFYLYRRDNFFFNTVESLLGESALPLRSGKFKDADPRLVVNNPELGARQELGRVHYWHENRGTSFISLVNQSGKAQVIEPEGIIFKNEKLPRFKPMTIPLAQEKKSTYDFILIHDLPLAAGYQLHYATSELLTQRDFNGETLLVLHGTQGSWGELALDAPGLKLISQDSGIHTEETQANRITLSYQHGPNQIAVLQRDNGAKLRVLITTTEDAGRLWFIQNKGRDIVLGGLDEVRTVGDSITIQYDERPGVITMLSPEPVAWQNLTVQNAYAPTSGLTVFAKPSFPEKPQLPLLSSARIYQDRAETLPDFDDSAWISVEGEPKALEFLDIYSGHAWYRTQFEIPAVAKLEAYDHLYIDSASDMVGIYVNGTYIATVNPFGTEIDNQSRNPNYRFPGLSRYLHAGKNTLVFRTEIWGHGSFMFGRGTIIGTTARLPALPYDGLKGLYGKARIGDLDLTRWKVGTGLGGERNPQAGTWSAPIDGSQLNLDKGDITWYRTEFSTTDLPDPEVWAAPVSLELTGRGTKATIFLNGAMIGRWLSDENWLQKGFWGRPQRGMWVPLSADQFPLPYEMLRSDGQPNELRIAFEDASSDADPAGRVDRIQLRYNQEGMQWKDGQVQRVEGVKRFLILQ